MWLLFGSAAILFAAWNVVWILRRTPSGILGYASLSFTALTLCAFYQDIAVRASSNDMGGIIDIAPTTSGMLWILTVLSIAINSISIFSKRK